MVLRDADRPLEAYRAAGDDETRHAVLSDARDRLEAGELDEGAVAELYLHALERAAVDPDHLSGQAAWDRAYLQLVLRTVHGWQDGRLGSAIAERSPERFREALVALVGVDPERFDAEHSVYRGRFARSVRWHCLGLLRQVPPSPAAVDAAVTVAQAPELRTEAALETLAAWEYDGIAGLARELLADAEPHSPREYAALDALLAAGEVGAYTDYLFDGLGETPEGTARTFRVDELLGRLERLDPAPEPDRLFDALRALATDPELYAQLAPRGGFHVGAPPDGRLANVRRLLNRLYDLDPGRATALFRATLTDDTRPLGFRLDCLEALRTFLDDPDAALEPALSCEHPDLRFEAAQTLARRGHDAAVDRLGELAGDPDPAAPVARRRAALRTLGEVGTDRSVRAIEAAVDPDPGPAHARDAATVNAVAVEVLVALAADVASADAALDRLAGHDEALEVAVGRARARARAPSADTSR